MSNVYVTMETKVEISCELLCTACLCVGRNLRMVTDQKLKQFYLSALNEIPLCNTAATSPILCWECEALLRKAVAFWEQVQDSYRILQSYTNEIRHEYLLTDITRPPRLKVVTHDPINIIPSLEDDDRVGEVQLVYVKDEVKDDWDGGHDIDMEALEDYPTEMKLSECLVQPPELENDIGLLMTDKKRKNNAKRKVKKTEKAIRRLEITKKTKKSKPSDYFISVNLSHEDILLEREQNAAKESYARAQFKCDSCIVSFKYGRLFDAHVAGRHSPNIGNYICPICKTIIASVDAFTAHFRRHKRRFECCICKKRTIDRARIIQHMQVAHSISVSNIKCKKCGHVSKCPDSHINHLDTHKGRFKCPDCIKSFKHRGGLKNHIIAVHELKNKFPCRECGKVFRWRNSLLRHLEGHSASEKTTEAAFCEPCKISFKSVCSYQRHLKNSIKHVSYDQRKYVCDHCHRRFVDKTKIRDHIESKHLHKTYQCPVCPKISKNRVNLDQHIRNVHKGRPNNKMCHHCGQVFPTKVQLESHMRTHTGERPFICEYCPTTFSQKSNLYKHYRQVHLNIKSKRYPFKKSKEDKTELEPAVPEQQVPLVPPVPYRPAAAAIRCSPDAGYVM